jgi:hypothetical protein
MRPDLVNSRTGVPNSKAGRRAFKIAPGIALAHFAVAEGLVGIRPPHLIGDSHESPPSHRQFCKKSGLEAKPYFDIATPVGAMRGFLL